MNILLWSVYFIVAIALSAENYTSLAKTTKFNTDQDTIDFFKLECMIILWPIFLILGCILALPDLIKEIKEL